MSTSTTSDPLPVPALPAHHATPIETGFAGGVPAVGEYSHEELERIARAREADRQEELRRNGAAQAEGKGSAIDLRGFAAGTASGFTKLVVGAFPLPSNTVSKHSKLAAGFEVRGD